MSTCEPSGEALSEALSIDARGVFGGGSHPSTRLLLEALASRVSWGLRVLDVGTGSGILALAAARLGAAAHGIDTHERAIACALANRDANQIAARRDRGEGSATFEIATAAEHGTSYPLVLANLFSNTLRELGATLFDRVAPGGILLASGVLLVDVTRTRAALTGAGFSLSNTRAREGWALLELARARCAR